MSLTRQASHPPLEEAHLDSAPGSSYFPSVFLLCISVLLGGRLFLLIRRYAVNVLFWDQWDFYDAFFQNRSLLAIFFWQHGPHRQGIGFVFEKVVADATGWNSKTEAYAIGAVMCLALLVAIYLKGRLFGSLWYWDAAIPLMFFTPVQFEIWAGTLNPSHGSFPLLLAVAYCVSWTLGDNRVKYAAILLINFFLIHTGFGLFMGFITPVLLLQDCHQTLQRRQTSQLVYSFSALFLSLVSVSSFFMWYTLHPGCFQFLNPNLLAYPSFIGVMFANYFGIKGHDFTTALLGMGLFVLATVVFLYHARILLKEGVSSRHVSLVVTILVGYSLLFSLTTAVGRVCLGIEAGQSSRYMPYLIPAWLGLYFHLLSLPKDRLRIILLAAYLVALIAGSFPMRQTDTNIAEWLSNGKRSWAACYLKSENIEQCDASTGFKIYPRADATRLKEKLDYLKQHKLNLYRDRT